ncbi:hypothetical protein PYW07_002521 [Mythimna separata]|uniref:Uncharacterized protein n=1 Tax=Mythimna separata TaxID=271217 RepID=A0AAD7YMZ8_MYTSE|nr:hypothetical protein PYW07_002521 [Mythimna separata]
MQVSQPAHFKGWADLRNRQIDTFPKFTYPLMMLAAQDLHFRFDLRQVDLYGVEHNGSFDGLVGRLQRQEAEVGLASFFIRPDRMRVADFISETCVLACTFIFRQPSRSAVSNVFLAPFSGGVWAACGGVAAAAAALLVALRRARPHAGLALFTLPEALTFALGTLCQQGFHSTPAVSSVRVVMFSTLLAALFVFTAYSAKIVAILQTPSDALRSIADLTRSPMVVGVQETTYKKVYFQESPDEATQQLYRRKIEPQGERAYLSVVDGIARVRTGFFAFQVEQSAGYDIIKQTFTEREKCSLKEIEAFKLPLVAVPMRKHSGYRELFATSLQQIAAFKLPLVAVPMRKHSGYRELFATSLQQIAAFKLPLVAVPMRKHSGYRELFATRLRWQREVGLMDRERRIWLVSRPRCEASSGGFVSIGIIDVLPALQVLALGAFLSVVLLASEVGVHELNRRTREYHDSHQRREGTATDA